MNTDNSNNSDKLEVFDEDFEVIYEGDLPEPRRILLEVMHTKMSLPALLNWMDLKTLMLTIWRPTKQEPSPSLTQNSFKKRQNMRRQLRKDKKKNRQRICSISALFCLF